MEEEKELLTDDECKASIGKKISEMLKSFGVVSEDGENKFSNYGYISSNKMVGLMREHLSEFGLSVIPEVNDYKETVSVYTDANGNEKAWIRTVVEMNFEIIDTDTGFSIIKKFFGADQDTGGKSFGQAVTECCKRFYFKLFQVSSSDEKDPDGKTTSTQKDDKKPAVQRQLTKDEVDNKWVGKIYGDTVYINNEGIKPPKEQLEKLKKHPKYKPSEKKQ